MSKTTLLVSGAAALLLSLVPQLQAVDSDPGAWPYKADATARHPRGTDTIGYRPTLHYYGKDYTVSYGYVAYNSRILRQNPVIQNDASVLPAGEVNAKTGAPRVTLYRRKPAASVAKLTPVVVPTPASKPVAGAPATPGSVNETAPQDASKQ